MRKLLWLTLIPVILCSCAHNNWHGGELTHIKARWIDGKGIVPLEAQLKNDFGAKWDYYGHYNTAGVVARIAGHSDEYAARIAYFSQAPDNLRTFGWGYADTNRYPQPSLLYNAVPVAIWGTLIPPFWGYRQRIEGALHSLHGGNQLEVLKRQKRLQSLIAKIDKADESEDWKAGFLIHALGDSYAHVYPSSAGGESAYGPFVGHGLDCGKIGPDKISQHFEHYEKYVRALYEALGGSDQTEALEVFLSRVKREANSTCNQKIAESKVKEFIASQYPYPSSQCEIIKEHQMWRTEIHLSKVNMFLKQLTLKLAE